MRSKRGSYSFIRGFSSAAERAIAQLCAFSVFYAYTIGSTYAQVPPSDPGVIVDPESNVRFNPSVWYNENDSTPVVDITAPQNGISLNQYMISLMSTKMA